MWLMHLKNPGYSSTMKSESLLAFEYPKGSEWQKLFASGQYRRPDNDY